MAISPLRDGSGVVTFKIILDGTILPDSVEVISIRTEHQLNHIPYAIIEIKLPIRDRNPFGLSENANFAPGTSVTISAGYDGRESDIFTGIVSGQAISGASSNPTLSIQCEHKAALMDLEKRSATFTDLKNAEIIAQICGENGISVETDDSGHAYASVSQVNMTDWDFIVQRAMLSDLFLVCEDDKVMLKKQGLSAKPALKLSFGKDVYDFNLVLDQSSQLKSGRSKKVEKVATKVHKNLRGQKTVPPTGTLDFPGSALAQLNTSIELADFGDYYSGKQLISGVHHTIEEGRWTTSVEVGLDIIKYLEVAEEVIPSSNEDNQENGASEAAVLQYMTYDEDSETLTIKDTHQNEIVLSNEGISIKSQSDLHLEAKGSILLNADNKIDAQADGNLIGHGQTVELYSDSSFKATGASSAELSSSATTTVKGSIVMIN